MHVVDQEAVRARVHLFSLTYIEATDRIAEILRGSPRSSHGSSAAPISQDTSLQLPFFDDFFSGNVFHGCPPPLRRPFKVGTAPPIASKHMEFQRHFGRRDRHLVSQGIGEGEQWRVLWRVPRVCTTN